MDTKPKPLAVGEHPPRPAATPAQPRLLQLMREGRRLSWFGHAGPELEGHPFWPQKRTVHALLRAGRLRWLPYRNATQRSCGIRELEAKLSNGMRRRSPRSSAALLKMAACGACVARLEPLQEGERCDLCGGTDHPADQDRRAEIDALRRAAEICRRYREDDVDAAEGLDWLVMRLEEAS